MFNQFLRFQQIFCKRGGTFVENSQHGQRLNWPMSFFYGSLAPFFVLFHSFQGPTGGQPVVVMSGLEVAILGEHVSLKGSFMRRLPLGI